VQVDTKVLTIFFISYRYGGRLFTAPHGDAYLEYGANWIHGGSEENELFKLARQRSLLSDNLNLENRTKGFFYTSTGQTIDGQLGEKCYQLFFDAETEAGRLYRSDSRMKQKLASKSLLQYLEEVWQRLAEKEFGADLNDPVRQQAESIFLSMILYFRSHVGNDLSLVPAILHGTFENVAEEDVKMPNGMRALVDEFYVNLPKGTIEFDTTVTGIFWDESSNGSSSGEWLDHPVKITTDHGVTWRAKHVICTLPLGVLKRSHDKIFHPPLPPVKVRKQQSKPAESEKKYFNMTIL
jgi:monoamine oxidase